MVFSSVTEDGKNIISFAIEKDRRYQTVYHPPNSDFELEEFDDDESLVGFFEFDYVTSGKTPHFTILAVLT